MKRLSLYFSIIFLVILYSCDYNSNSIKLSGRDLGIEFDEKGQIVKLFDINDNTDYLKSDSLSFLIHIRANQDIIEPNSISYKKHEGILLFSFPGGTEVKLKVEQKQEYISFELLNIKGKAKPDLLIWGPVYTSISEIIGETIGVVRNNNFAIGIQSLNPKTLGGYPWRENELQLNTVLIKK